MGRFYNGDIEGKFWFGVQASDDALHFGAEETEPAYIDYYVDDLEAVEAGLNKAREQLGEDEQRLNDFFKSVEIGYNNEMIIKHYQEAYQIELLESQINEKLALLARIQLGEKIHHAVKENGSCSFSADI
jgi:hypothetical protein